MDLEHAAYYRSVRAWNAALRHQAAELCERAADARERCQDAAMLAASLPTEPLVRDHNGGRWHRPTR